MAGDPATIWLLVASGLKAFPSLQPPTPTKIAGRSGLEYVQRVGRHTMRPQFPAARILQRLHGRRRRGPHASRKPSIKRPLASTCTRPDPQAPRGRGAPDVSAVSRRQPALHLSRGTDMTGNDACKAEPVPPRRSGRALFSQVNAIFRDQGLPQSRLRERLVVHRSSDRAGRRSMTSRWATTYRRWCWAGTTSAA